MTNPLNAANRNRSTIYPSPLQARFMAKLTQNPSGSTSPFELIDQLQDGVDQMLFVVTEGGDMESACFEVARVALWLAELYAVEKEAVRG